jgi:hypothetical protein
MISRRPLALLALLAAGCCRAPAASTPAASAVTPIELPAAAPGIGFDDLHFSAAYGLLVPAGRTGLVDLVDPTSLRVTSIGGFSRADRYEGKHDDGPTSVDEGAGLFFLIDHGAKKVLAVDPRDRVIVASAPLAEDPDYVRWVEPTRELWVTQPDAEQVEIFQLHHGKGGHHLTSSAAIKIPKGPEGLLVDLKRGRAYVNSWKSQTFAIDLKSRAIVATWRTSCKKSRGLAFDGGSLLFVGCGEGGAVTIDVDTGAELGAAPAGEGVDIIAYSPSLRHLYVPGGKAETLTVMAVSPKGWLTPLGTLPTAKRAHCVATDDRGTAFVCDPDKGRILAVRDPFVKSY